MFECFATSTCDRINVVTSDDLFRFVGPVNINATWYDKVEFGGFRYVLIKQVVCRNFFNGTTCYFPPFVAVWGARILGLGVDNGVMIRTSNEFKAFRSFFDNGSGCAVYNTEAVSDDHEDIFRCIRELSVVKQGYVRRAKVFCEGSISRVRKFVKANR